MENNKAVVNRDLKGWHLIVLTLIFFVIGGFVPYVSIIGFITLLMSIPAFIRDAKQRKTEKRIDK